MFILWYTKHQQNFRQSPPPGLNQGFSAPFRTLPPKRERFVRSWVYFSFNCTVHVANINETKWNKTESVKLYWKYLSTVQWCQSYFCSKNLKKCHTRPSSFLPPSSFISSSVTDDKSDTNFSLIPLCVCMGVM